jgi:hypothetical protein
MLQNAQYSVWFRTPAGEGHGIISVMDGDVSGGDNISSYTGTYVQEGDRFAATLSVKRHTQGSPSVFEMVNPTITPLVSKQLTPRAGVDFFWPLL